MGHPGAERILGEEEAGKGVGKRRRQVQVNQPHGRMQEKINGYP